MGNDNLAILDPQLVELLRSLKESGAPELQTLSPPDARVAYQKGVQLLSGHAPDIKRTVDTSIEASDSPTLEILAFIAQIPGPEVHLPTEAAIIGYLEKCRRKDAAPVRSALLTILIPGMASARLGQWK